MTAADSVSTQIGQWQRTSLLIGVAGVLLAMIGFLLDREQFLRSYLFAYVYLDRHGPGLHGHSAASSHGGRQVGHGDPPHV